MQDIFDIYLYISIYSFLFFFGGGVKQLILGVNLWSRGLILHEKYNRMGSIDWKASQISALTLNSA